MAYASKYYDPQKAHDYYMKNRQLKGYANRYGGARGDGTSAASGMPVPAENKTTTSSTTTTKKTSGSPKVEYKEVTASGPALSSTSKITDSSKISNYRKNSGKVAGQKLHGYWQGGVSKAMMNFDYVVRASTGDDTLDELAEKYDIVKNGLAALKKSHKETTANFRKDWKSLSKEDKASYTYAINYNNNLHKQDVAAAKKEIDQLKTAMKQRREQLKAEKAAERQKQKEEHQKQKAEKAAERQKQKEERERQKIEKQKQRAEKVSQKQSDTEAKAYIKNQMDMERDETVKKVNKSVDDDMLTEAKRFADNLQKRRKNGEQIDNKVVLSQLKAMSGRAKKTKIKNKRKYINEYNTRYKEEMDNYYKNR